MTWKKVIGVKGFFNVLTVAIILLVSPTVQHNAFHESPGIRQVINFNLLNLSSIIAGIVGKVFVAIFDLSHLTYSNKYFLHHPSNKQIEVYHAKSG